MPEQVVRDDVAASGRLFVARDGLDRGSDGILRCWAGSEDDTHARSEMYLFVRLRARNERRVDIFVHEAKCYVERTCPHVFDSVQLRPRHVGEVRGRMSRCRVLLVRERRGSELASISDGRIERNIRRVRSSCGREHGRVLRVATEECVDSRKRQNGPLLRN